MTLIVFLAVILAALLHASWNALVKGGRDKHLGMAAVVLGQGLLALPVLIFVPPPNPASYPLMATGVLLHLGYQLFLLASYRSGDLTQVYPLARGSAPMIVAGVSVVFLGVPLAPLQLGAVALIGLGIISIALVRKQGGQRNPHAAALALITGGFIASYSIVDGLGARLAGSVLGFYGWMAVANAVLFSAVAAWRWPTVLRRVPTEGRRALLLGGGASYAAYALVLWAFTQSPIALVTALRETSIIFALLIGVFVLGERLSLGKVIATIVTLAGVILLRFAR